MAAAASTHPTLLDVVKRTDPDSQIAQIVEALTERNPVLQDAPAMEGNLATGHRVTIRAGLPTLSWRRLNDGIDPSKSETIQVDEACGLLEGRSEVDCELARLNGNEAAFRFSEDRAFMSAMSNEAMSALFYANTAADPEKILGWTPRYQNTTLDNGGNIINYAAISGDASSGDQMSIWFITWGPETAYLIYPKGMNGGLTSEDLGKEYVTGANSKQMLAWRTHWTWRLGLCVKDWRYHVRIGNIDEQNYLASEDFLIECMVRAYNRIYDLTSGRTVIYMNRTMLTWVDLQIMNKTNVWFSPMEWHGHRVASFRGIPIMPCDGLITSESVLTVA